ncbi:MAG: acyl-CoA dehydrogenase family protein, partial [Achromobacter mucicolens]
MNFEHTEDRRMLSDMLRRFVAEQYDFTTRMRHAESREGYSPEFWRRYAELGAIGALFTEADGGLGGAGFDISVVFEALGRGLVVEPFLDAVMVGSAIAAAGSPAQREALDGLIAGSLTSALAHAEPASGYDLNQVATRAEPSPDGWVLNGAKAVVYAGEHADLFLVSARTAGNVDDESGIGLFLVTRGTPGLALRGYGLIDGGRAAELVLDNVKLAPDALLGDAQAGHALLERAVGRGILALCAEAVGAMDCARDATLEYLRTRR